VQAAARQHAHGGRRPFRPDEFAKKLASSKNANWCFVQWEYAFSTGVL